MLAYEPWQARRKPAAALVIGGGVGGMRAALDIADAGLKVYLVEQTPCLGGRVAQLGFMFPQHDCVLCRGTPDHGYGCTRPSISPVYLPYNRHPNIEVLTNTHLLQVEGEAGDFTAFLRQEPRYVNAERCINCGRCARVCPVELPDLYQAGLTRHKAAYKVAARAIPDAYCITRGPYCDACRACEKVCPTQAIDLDERPRLLTLEVGAIVLALGFQTYPVAELEEFGYGRYPNVVQAMEYERLASRSGPTEGIVVRPSDKVPPRSIAWLQCIGARDREVPYCSSICCMYATKEAILAKQRLGKEIRCDIFLMDERAFNKEYSRYFDAAWRKYDIHYHRSRPSMVLEDPQTHNLLLNYVDVDGTLHSETFEMVVLATGLRPPETARQLAQILGIEINEYGFCRTDKFSPLQTSRPGIFVCGAFSSPKEIAETILDASGAAAEVIRLLNARLHTFPYAREAPFITPDGLPPERAVEDESPRLGLFLCTCGGTNSEVLDFTALSMRARTWPGVVFTEVLDYLCFPEGLQRIQEAVSAQNLNRVVVGACSNRTHDSLFQRTVRMVGLNPYLFEGVNLREQCVRVHRSRPSQAQRKAVELLRMASERVRLAHPVHKETYPCLPVALVLGGGLAGMTAALTIADSGYDVHLIERSERLGGNLLDLYYVAEGYNPQRLLRDLVNRVRAHPRIVTHLHSELVRQDGQAGAFRSEIRTRMPGRPEEHFLIEHGVTIVATGARELREHPWLQLPGVITQRELEERIIHHPEQIATLREVVMIQCVRAEGVASYCSRVCCTNAMKNAIRLRLFNPSCRVTVLYKNIVTYGFREQYYTEARRLGVIFARYTDEQPPEVLFDASQGRLQVRFWEAALGHWQEVWADLVPLSMPVIPSEGTQKLARLLRLPLSSEGFFEEAQMKLRPMDFGREGIFLAGMAHYPKFIEETISHAQAAAARAVTFLSPQKVWSGGAVAQVDAQKCVGCLTCTRTCPFGIPQVVQWEGRHGIGGLGGAAWIDPTQCHGCGTCTAECPANAIQLVHYTDEQIFLRSVKGLGAWLPSTETVMRGKP